MIVFEDDLLEISARQEVSDTEANAVLLSFTGVGHGMGGITVQKPEFFGAGRTFDNVLFITDKTRSWGNCLDFQQIKTLTAPFILDRKVVSIGNSMGGFNAIVSTHFIPTKTCISFVPQFSVSSQTVPWETRWQDYTRAIQDFEFESAGDYMNDSTQYFIFSGGRGLDRRQADLFPVQSNIHHYSFPTIGHHIGAELKKMGLLKAALECCFHGQRRLPPKLAYTMLSPAKA